jgi:ATP-dependent DNA helicase RecQ
MVKKQNGSGIIYVRYRKKTQEIANFLMKQQVSSSLYHAGIDSRIRDKRQKQWMSGEIRVIVATNAFGMGIDKDNVRFVAHLDLPDNPEAYFQEAGRAGRDGQKAYSVIFWDQSDLINLNQNYENSYPPISQIKATYKALGNYLNLAVGSGKGLSFKFDIIHFSKQYDFSPLIAFNCIKILEKQGLLLMNDAVHKPSKIKILLQGGDLYRFQVDHPKYDNLLKYLLRNYSGIFQEYTPINEMQIQKTFNASKEQVQNYLLRLVKMDVLDYLPESNQPEIIFINERLADKDIYISPETYHLRKEAAYLRMKAMKNYVESNHKCRSKILLTYFGEQNSKRCGMCDVCLERNKAHLSKLEFDQVVELIKPLLKERRMLLDELVFEVDSVDADRLLSAIQWLRENDKIKEDENQNLYWF